MTFNELFETRDEKLEKYFQKSDDWHWYDVQDFHTHEWSTVAKCQINENVLSMLKKKGIKINDKFHIEGIGKLELQYESWVGAYYVELIEKDI